MEGAQTLERGIRVLSLVGDSPNGLTITELSRELAVARTVVYRLTATLESNALITRSDDGRYRIGMGVLAFAAHLRTHIQQLAAPILESLANDLGATTVLAAAESGHAVVVAMAVPTGVDHLGMQLGAKTPLQHSGFGRALEQARIEPTGAAARTFEVAPIAPSPVWTVGVAIAGTSGYQLALGVCLLNKPLPGVRPTVLRGSGEISVTIN